MEVVIVIQYEPGTLTAEKLGFQKFLAIFHRHLGSAVASSTANTVVLIQNTPLHHRDDNQHQ